MAASKSAAAILLLLLLAGQAHAGVKADLTSRHPPKRGPNILDGSSTFMVDPPPDLVADSQVTKPGQPLTVLILHAERAVRIDQAVTGFRFKSKRTLAQGDILMGMTERPDIFCAPLSAGLSAADAPCLSDREGDGKFEGGFSGTATTLGTVNVALTLKGWITGIEYRGLKPLPATVGYEPVDYSLGPAGSARLAWKSNYDRAHPGQPVTLEVWLDATEPGSKATMRAATSVFNLVNGAGTITYQGIVIDIQGFDADGSVRYRIVSVSPGQPVHFDFNGLYPPLPTIFIYMPSR